MGIESSNLKQGSIISLFPNLRMGVIANGVECQIIAVTENEIKCEVTNPFKSGYKIGTQFWVDSFLIKCPHCNGSGAVKIGQNEYSICPCV